VPSTPRRLAPSSYLESEISGTGGAMARCPVRAGAKSAARRAEDGTERLSGSFAAPLPCLDDLRGLAALAWLSQRWEALLAWWQQADGAKGKPVLRRGSIHFCQDSRPPGEVLELGWLGVQSWAGLVLRV